MCNLTASIARRGVETGQSLEASGPASLACAVVNKRHGLNERGDKDQHPKLTSDLWCHGTHTRIEGIDEGREREGEQGGRRGREGEKDRKKTVFSAWKGTTHHLSTLGS